MIQKQQLLEKNLIIPQGYFCKKRGTQRAPLFLIIVLTFSLETLLLQRSCLHAFQDLLQLQNVRRL